ALLAPGTSSVWPTSTTTRKAARSQVGASGFFAGAAAGSAPAKGAMPKNSTETKSQVLLVRQEDPMNPTSFVGPVSRAFVALLGIVAPNQHMFRENGKRFPNKDLRKTQGSSSIPIHPIRD